MTGPWIDGTFVNPKGNDEEGDGVGHRRGGRRRRRQRRAGPGHGPCLRGRRPVPNFGRVAYVAASADEIAIVKTKSGVLKMKIGEEVLACVPRSQIASVDLDEGRLLSHLKVAFTNGVVWEFDVPKANKKTAQNLVRALV